MSENFKTEAELKCDILDILDPGRLSTEYNNMTLMELREFLDKQTNAVKRFDHSDFQAIYDMVSPGHTKVNENITLKNRIMKQNAIIEEQRKIISDKENELFALKIEYEKLRLQKSFKDEVYEEGSFAAFVATQESEEDGNVKPVIVSTSSFTPSTPSKETLGQMPAIVQRYAAPYISYTPSRFNNKSTVFGSSSPYQQTFYNGREEEEEAFKKAIRESELDAERIIDAPFEKASIDDPFVIIDTHKTETPVKKKYSYSHLTGRPLSLTDDMLDDMVEILMNREYEKIKPLLMKWPTECSTFTRLLTYGSETFKQMMASKSMNIHKCITGDI